MNKRNGFTSVFTAVVLMVCIAAIGLVFSFVSSGKSTLVSEFLKGLNAKKQPAATVAATPANNNYNNVQVASTMAAAPEIFKTANTLLQPNKDKLSLEKTIRVNLQNSNYVATAGSTGQTKEAAKKEISQIMNEYAIQLNEQVMKTESWFDNSTPARSSAVFNNVKNDLATLISATDYSTKLFTKVSQKNELLTKMAMVNMVICFNTPDKTGKNFIDRLSVSLAAYNNSLPTCEFKSFMEESTNDLISASKGIQYSIDPSLYSENIGQYKNNSIKQDQELVDRMFKDFDSYSAGQKERFTSKLGVVPVKKEQKPASTT